MKAVLTASIRVFIFLPPIFLPFAFSGSVTQSHNLLGQREKMMFGSFHSRWARSLAALALCLTGGWVSGQDFEREPINYETAPVDNPVSRLQARLDSGESKLEYDDRVGYLKSVLRELGVPESSQMLVFSKTSLQRHRIAPRTPRAIYFNDDVYAGFCQHGDVAEFSAVDPQLGVVFYTLDQEQSDKPRFTRQNDNCLLCHASTQTRSVPGHLVRSVYVDAVGFPVFAMGTHRIDHTSPLAKRWGGWYVTGTHGEQTHLGNLIVSGKPVREPVDNTKGHNVTDLGEMLKTSAYLTPHSDLVALMVLEHQAETHNLITRANFTTREALHAEAHLNKDLNEPEGHRWQSTTTRIQSAGNELVKFLLFSGEAPLTSKLQGTSSFATEFTARGPRDPQGRSLRDFDNERRLFKYPCSYLIYSRSFDGLPREATDFVYRRLWEVLSGADKSKDFAHLSATDRAAIREILIATKPALPDYWKTSPTTEPTQ